SNERNQRGGFSLYVPEQWDRDTSMPLVVALHGGHGHGRDFLWSWLTEARSRGVLLLSPTSRDRTWSIMGGEDIDAESLREMVSAVAARYPIDRSRVLLTGMSDGATYSLLCGLRDGMPFTTSRRCAACCIRCCWPPEILRGQRDVRSTSSTARSTGCFRSTQPISLARRC